MRGCWTGALLTLAIAGAAMPAAADDCKLTQLASVNMSSMSSTAVLVPVSLEGTTKLMAIDTGSPLTAVEPGAADELHFVTHRIMEGYIFAANGETFSRLATIHTLDIGHMHGDYIHALIWPSSNWNDSRVAGTLGADFLRHYDIDIDFDAKKFNIFSQDHCPGKVVYWHPSNVMVVPIRVVNSGHIIVPVMLDGHRIDALLDTGAFGTVLSLEAAQNIFGLGPNSPGMEPSGKFHGTVPMYRHTFKSLELGGITISSPTVFMWADQMKSGIQQTIHAGSRLDVADERLGGTELTLGMRELRRLHLYIAYKEQKLYISPETTLPPTDDQSKMEAAPPISGTVPTPGGDAASPQQ